MTVLHEQLASLFNRTFSEDHGVFMHGGFAEPLYLPAQHPPGAAGRTVAEIRYTRDHAASVLHEAAHWCIAGYRRRQLIDYGYPYLAPPRDSSAQAAFFQAELRNQALEKLFSAAAGVGFRISVDDLGMACQTHCEGGAAAPANVQAREAFAHAVDRTARNMLAQGLAPRAAGFLAALEDQRLVRSDTQCGSCGKSSEYP